MRELFDVVKELKARSHKIVYWVADKNWPLDRSQFSGTIFHDLEDAIEGRSAAAVDTSQFTPPGDDLIAQLYETESLLLTMMNKRYGHLSVSERKRFYYRLIQYWQGILKHYRPDVIIFPLVPHSVYDLVIYFLAKLLGIKTVMFTATQDFIRLMVMNDFVEGGRILKKTIEENKQKQFSLEDLSDDLRGYFFKHTSQGGDPTPPNMINIQKQYGRSRAAILLDAIKSFTLFSKAVNYAKKRFGSNLRKEYQGLEKPPDLSRNFIYVPLQYQPEATTSPLAGNFADQCLLIETLAAAIPDSWVIYVKEHPRQFIFSGLNFSQYRYCGYYEDIARLKKVQIVPTTTDTYSLINFSKAVAINTGTAGLEAALRLKPVLVFGYAWYRDCPGMFVVRDTDSCREAIKKIIGGARIDTQQLINYFAAVDRASFPGYVEPHLKKLSTISEEENVANLTKALIDEIETS